MAEVQYRIDSNTAIWMGVVCAFVELLGLIGLIPFVGSAINTAIVAIAEVIFIYWFKRYGIEFFKGGKNIFVATIASLFEIVLGFLPAFSLQIAIIVLLSWIEDRATAETPEEADAPKQSAEPNTPRQTTPSI